MEMLRLLEMKIFQWANFSMGLGSKTPSWKKITKKKSKLERGEVKSEHKIQTLT